MKLIKITKLNNNKEYFAGNRIGGSGLSVNRLNEYINQTVHDKDKPPFDAPALKIGEIMHDILENGNSKILDNYERNSKRKTTTGDDLNKMILGNVIYDFLDSVLYLNPFDIEKIKKDSSYFEGELGRHIDFQAKYVDGYVDEDFNTETEIHCRYKPDLFFILKEEANVAYMIDWKSYGNMSIYKKPFDIQAKMYSYCLLREFTEIQEIRTIYVVFNKIIKDGDYKVTVESAGNYKRCEAFFNEMEDLLIRESMLQNQNGKTASYKKKLFKDVFPEEFYLGKYLTPARKKLLNDSREEHKNIRDKLVNPDLPESLKIDIRASINKVLFSKEEL